MREKGGKRSPKANILGIARKDHDRSSKYRPSGSCCNDDLGVIIALTAQVVVVATSTLNELINYRDMEAEH